jgi:hypothetical protein
LALAIKARADLAARSAPPGSSLQLRHSVARRPQGQDAGANIRAIEWPEERAAGCGESIQRLPFAIRAKAIEPSLPLNLPIVRRVWLDAVVSLLVFASEKPAMPSCGNMTLQADAIIECCRANHQAVAHGLDDRHILENRSIVVT